VLIYYFLVMLSFKCRLDMDLSPFDQENLLAKEGEYKLLMQFIKTSNYIKTL
jgi:hypothetical protein